jgi:UDP-2-acetamido-3-amino-2,3-dideoxy-glucuronate N-acetyltransferase
MSVSESAFVHPTAEVHEAAGIGADSHIWHFCHVMAGASIGEDVSLGQNCFVAPGVTIGRGSRLQNNVSVYEGVELAEDVFVGPSAVFTNVRNPRAFVSRKDEYEVIRVERGATIGANATIVCGVTIGSYAFVAAGAVVTRDVLPHSLVAGVPATPAGWACRCGERLRFKDEGQAVCSRCSQVFRYHGEGVEEQR